MPSRIIFHPILENRRSRLIFFIFLTVSLAFGYACWNHLKKTLAFAGIAPDSPLLLSSSSAKLLTSISFWIGVLVVTTIIATAFTAWQVVGPTARIEQWLRDWNDNLNPFALLVRKNDKFARLAKLLNQLYQKANRPPQN